MALCVFAGAWTVGCGSGAEPEASPLERLREDPRVSELIYSCANSGYFDRDTSDMVGILMEKLERGQMEPLRRAREELAQMGDEALLAVARLVQRTFSEELTTPYLQNAVDVLAMAPREDGPGGEAVHAALLRCLEYHENVVRTRALQALASGWARPEDYERLMQQLAVEPPMAQVHVVSAIFAADPERAEAEALRWLEAGEQRHLWINLLSHFGQSGSDAVVAAAGRLYRDGPTNLRTRMAALAARHGDSEAREFLRGLTRSEEEDARVAALDGLAAAGDAEAVAERLREDPSAAVRALCVNVLVQLGQPDVAVPALRSALEDGYSEVRAAALQGLLDLGVPEALDRALIDLSSPNPDTVRASLEALKGPMGADPELARRALERLLARDAQASGQSVQARQANFQFIGTIPRPEAARYLRQVALENPDARVGQLGFHRWVMIQAANTGLEGRAFLASELAQEADPIRRLDLLWAVSAQRDELARDTFLAAFDAAASSDLERLYLTDRLVRNGPAREVAPLLKDRVLRIEDPEARRGAQCLLWKWY